MREQKSKEIALRESKYCRKLLCERAKRADFFKIRSLA